MVSHFVYAGRGIKTKVATWVITSHFVDAMLATKFTDKEQNVLRSFLPRWIPAPSRRSKKVPANVQTRDDIVNEAVTEFFRAFPERDGRRADRTHSTFNDQEMRCFHEVRVSACCASIVFAHYAHRPWRSGCVTGVKRHRRRPLPR